MSSFPTNVIKSPVMRFIGNAYLVYILLSGATGLFAGSDWFFKEGMHKIKDVKTGCGLFNYSVNATMFTCCYLGATTASSLLSMSLAATAPISFPVIRYLTKEDNDRL